METLNVYQAINKVMADCPAIGKDRKNAQQGFSYRGVEDVMNELKPLFSKYGLFVVPSEIIESGREERVTKSGGNMIYTTLKMKYTFYALDGSNLSASVQSEGMDTADKSSNKAIAAAFKYVCTQTFCIPTSDIEDADKTTPESSNKTHRGQEVTPDGEIVPPTNGNGKSKFNEETFLHNFNPQKDFQPLPLEEAKAEESAKEGAYGAMTTEQLFHRMTAILKRIREREMTADETPVVLRKLAAIQTILVDRKAQMTK
jgi:hypothetical protein